MKSYMARTGEVPRQWYVVDAQGKVLGRLASRMAMILRGKTKPTFTPLADTGDFVVVVNAAQVKLTGRKMDQKVYYRHSGYPGGIKSTPPASFLTRSRKRSCAMRCGACCPKPALAGIC